MSELRSHDWTEFDNLTDPNDAWTYLKNVINKAIDKQCPIKNIRVKDRNDPWISQEIIEMLHDKDEACKTAKSSGKPEDWKTARSLKHRANKAVRDARRDFITANLDTQQDPKKFWQSINSIIPNSEGKNLINLIDQESDESIELDKVAHEINYFFANIGEKLALNFDQPWHPTFPKVNDVMGDLTIDGNDVLKVCHDIDEKKSSAIDGLSSKILKHAFLAIPIKLCKCFVLSVTSGIFPDNWKMARVVPLFKGGDASNVSNYRPISLLPLPGKLLEKLVHQKLIVFIESHQILNCNQGGFRSGHSSIESATELVDDIAFSNNRNLSTLVTFVDFKKAFDTVNHSIVIRKLERLGVRGINKKWIKSYLTNRSQSTIANNSISTLLPINCGVPQGSILGPLIFLIYINDLVDSLGTIHARLYADDTALSVAGDDLTVMAEEMQNGLNRLDDWCKLNRLTVNASKTKLMLFPARKDISGTRCPDLILNNTTLESVNHYKYLGVTLDTKLNFQLHVQQVQRLASHKIYLLGKIRYLLTKEAALAIYRSKITPYFDYGDVLFHNANTNLLNKLQRLQNRALRICLNAEPRTAVDQLHNDAKLPFLHKRRICHIRVLGYKRSLKDKYVCRAGRNTRAGDAKLLNFWLARNALVARSAHNTCACEWNGLPPEVRNLRNLATFKRLQKKWLKSTVPIT